MSKIFELLEKDINRNINGVVKVDDKVTNVLKNEIEEYVVTKEVKKQFERIFSKYASSIENPNEDIGIWITGFFGSGKSHMLKMFGNILENHQFDGVNSYEFFKNKVNDEALYRNIEISGSLDTDVILFNIENISNKSNSDKNSEILTAFFTKFNEMQGYSKESLKVAEFERFLEGKGKYLEFKEIYKEIAGVNWEKDRVNISFVGDNFIEAVEELNLPGFSGDRAEIWLEDPTKPERPVSVDTFVEIVTEYLNTKGNNHRIVFLIDEVGQFIGRNTQMMLNLQSIVEQLGAKLHGKVWVAVTSQENLESILSGIRISERDDFSKIQGRFKTMLSLSSSNVDEVIKKRILLKKSSSLEFLELFYSTHKAEFDNLLDFQGMSSNPYWKNEKDFAHSYPFVSYQFHLLQNVFENARKSGLTGKHLSQGERSLLNAFHECTKKVQFEEVGAIVPFSMFFESIEQFLDGEVKRAFEKLSMGDNKVDDFTLNTYKLLFLLKGMEDKLKSDTTLLTTLSISNILETRKEVEEKIKNSLNILLQRNLIKKENDEYFYLTHEESEIQGLIRETEINEDYKSKFIGKMIFDEILTENEFLDLLSGKRKKRYAINKVVNGIAINNSKLDTNITLEVMCGEIDSSALDYAILDNTKITMLLDINHDLDNEIIQGIKVNEFNSSGRDKITSDKKLLALKEIVDYNNSVRIREIKENLKNLFLNSEIVISGAVIKNNVYSHEISINRNSPNALITSALTAAATNVFSKGNLIKSEYSDKIIKSLLSDITYDDNALGVESNIDSNPNSSALKEILTLLNLSRTQVTTIKYLCEKLSIKPYGWTNIEVQGLLCELYLLGGIKFLRNSATITTNSELIDILTKTNSNVQQQVLVKLTEKIDEKLKNSIKKQLEELEIPMKEISSKEFSDQVITSLVSYLVEKEKLLYKYKSFIKGITYPDKEVLEEYLEILKNIRNLNGDNSSKISKIPKYLDELLDLKEEFDRIDLFLGENNLKITFDKGVDFLNELHRDKEFLEYLFENEKYLKLESILKSKKPYPQIKDIPKLIEDLKSSIESDAYGVKESNINKIMSTKKIYLDAIKNSIEVVTLTESINSICNILVARIDSTKGVEIYKTSNRVLSLESELWKRITSEVLATINEYEKSVVNLAKNKGVFSEIKADFEKELNGEIKTKYNLLLNVPHDSQNIINLVDIVNIPNEMKYYYTKWEAVINGTTPPVVERVVEIQLNLPSKEIRTLEDKKAYMDLLNSKIATLEKEIDRHLNSSEHKYIIKIY